MNFFGQNFKTVIAAVFVAGILGILNEGGHPTSWDSSRADALDTKIQGIINDL